MLETDYIKYIKYCPKCKKYYIPGLTVALLTTAHNVPDTEVSDNLVVAAKLAGHFIGDDTCMECDHWMPRYGGA
jgi:hypothetical protein